MKGVQSRHVLRKGGRKVEFFRTWLELNPRRGGSGPCRGEVECHELVNRRSSSGRGWIPTDDKEMGC